MNDFIFNLYFLSEKQKNFIKCIIDKIDKVSDFEEHPNIKPLYMKPLLKDGENPNFMNASSAVELR